MSYTLKLFNDMVKSNRTLFAISTDATQVLSEKLEEFYRIKQLDCYRWQRGRGIFRTDLAGIYAPGSASFNKALFHVAHSRHFGIYLFENVSQDIKQAPLDLLDKIAKDRSEFRRIVLVTGNNLALPYQIKPLFKEHNYQTLCTNNIKQIAAR